MSNRNVILILFVGFVLLTGAVVGIQAQPADITDFEDPPPMPGQLIDVGGYHLHLSCIGEGSPTVVLEPGFARSSFNMQALQMALSGETRVCAYDHAGFGWSDPAPADVPRTTQQLSDELYTLLTTAAIDERYLLVAHSLGGFVARTFAAEHPAQVAGLLLLDATPPEFILSGVTAQQDQMLGLILQGTLATAQAGSWTPQNLAPVLSLTNDIIPEDRRKFIALAARPTYIEEALREWEGLQANAQAVIDAGSLGDLPLIVLAAGERLALTGEADIAWVKGQADQAALSTRGELSFVVGGSHEFYIDQPAIVARALRRLLTPA